MHIDLVPRFKKKRKPRRSGAREPESFHDHTVSDLRGQTCLWGCVCGRTTSSQGFYYAGFRLHLDQPTEDTCGGPHASWWKDYFPEAVPEAVPNPCTIGALGWLLSCRRAYAEGVDVLYGTNTLHIRRTYLCRYLSDWLALAIMHAITSVELIWNIHPFGEPLPGCEYRFPPGAGMSGFQTLLEMLPDTLPNLRYLYLSLDGDLLIRHRQSTFLETTNILLDMVDVMVGRFQGLKECKVSLSTFHYHYWKRNKTGSGLDREQEIDAPDKVRRDIPERNLDSCRSAKGYWVCHSLTYVGRHLW